MTREEYSQLSPSQMIEIARMDQAYHDMLYQLWMQQQAEAHAKRQSRINRLKRDTGAL